MVEVELLLGSAGLHEGMTRLRHSRSKEGARDGFGPPCAVLHGQLDLISKLLRDLCWAATRMRINDC